MPLFKHKLSDLNSEELHLKVQAYRKYLILPMLISLVFFLVIIWKRPDPESPLFIAFFVFQVILIPFIFRSSALNKELKKRNQ